MAGNNQTEHSHASYGGSSFEPIQNWDIDKIEPDVFPGKYRARCVKATPELSSTNKPMVVLDWKNTSTDDDSEGAQKSIGATKRDWIVFTDGRGGNFGKQKLRDLRDVLSIDPDVIPANFSTLEELLPLCEALRDAETDVWITPDRKRPGDTVLAYTAPRGSGLAPMGDEEEVDEPPKTAVRGKAAPAKAPAKKAARR
jgi:hypothetical protein